MKPYCLLCFAVIFFIGCHGRQRPADLPALYPVELTMTQENKPLADADVVLFARGDSGKWVPGGTTNAAGKVRLKVSGQYDGAPIGQYHVCVTKLDVGQVDARNEMVRTRPKSYRLVEEKYASPETTPLQIEISKGKNQLALDVGKEVRILIDDRY